jgi:hypothetical protein
MDDIDKLDATLERLESEQARRRAERIEAGEIVSVPLFIVAGSESVARAKVEQTKADKLAELRTAGDLREVVFDITLVVTGVVKFGEATGEPRKPMPSLRTPTVKQLPVDQREAEATPEAPLIETYIAVQIGQCQEDDPGQIREGYFSIDDGGTVTVTNATGKYVGSRALLQGEDARAVAKVLLREKKAPESEAFNRRLSYPNAGLA